MTTALGSIVGRLNLAWIRETATSIQGLPKVDVEVHTGLERSNFFFSVWENRGPVQKSNWFSSQQPYQRRRGTRGTALKP